MLPTSALYTKKNIGAYDQDGQTITVQGELGEGGIRAECKPYFAVGALSVSNFFDDMIERNDKLEPKIDALRSLALDGTPVPDELMAFQRDLRT